MSDALTLALRRRFRDTARERTAAMRSLLSSLATNPEDAAALRELLRHFHFFAGMGATCGFAEVSAIAHDGEAAVQAVVQTGAGADAEQRSAWIAMVARIEEQL